MKYARVQNFINGQFVSSDSPVFIDIISPLDGIKIGEMPFSSLDDLDAGVQAARTAFSSWSSTPIKDRVQVFYRYKVLLEKNLQELASLVQEENGKTIEEAKAEIEKCIELTEFACSLPQLTGGEILEVSKAVECRSQQVPLGVVASIVPFNFPAMVPNWTIPNAIALGNTIKYR
jgi:malonate-semialdehyde dehydrogenase (acetylating)/methylmalonate-semialdehyde dehydrogenase